MRPAPPCPPPRGRRRAALATLGGLLLPLAVAGAARLVRHDVDSPYQAGPQQIRVLLPDGYETANRYPVVYVLPTRAGDGGAPLELLGELDLPNRHHVIIATASFSAVPWYGDHPSDPAIRQESHLIDFVVPFIERTYATSGTADGRLLFGFSKGGRGAVSLLLRHPDLFGFAAAWDSPFLMNDLRFETARVFVTRDGLDRCRPDLLVPAQRAHFQGRPRLVIAGEDKFGPLDAATRGGSATLEMHALLAREGVPHAYRPDLRVKHAWDKAWIEPVLEELMLLARSSP